MARYALGYLGEDDTARKKRKKKRLIIIIIVVVILFILVLIVAIVVGYLVASDKEGEGGGNGGAGPDGQPGAIITTENEEGDEITCRVRNNVAYKGTATASSGASNPSYTTDGDIWSCAMTTGKDAYPWYFIFLGETYAVDSVSIRLPSYSTGALKNLQVRVGSNTELSLIVFYKNAICWEQAAPVPVDGIVKDDCEVSTVGKRISFQLVAGCGTCAFYICEVYAYGKHVPT